MLLSGAGLLLFAFGNIVEGAERAAREQARIVAQQLASLLQREAAPDLWPAVCRFGLADGAPVLRPEFLPLHTPPEPHGEAELPLRTWSLLRAARQKEVVERDEAGARAAMEQALASPGQSPRDRAYLLREAAWQALRLGAPELATQRFHALVGTGGAQAARLEPATAASALLLMRRLGVADDGLARGLSRRCAVLPPSARPGIDIPRDIADRHRILAAADRLFAAAPRPGHGTLVPTVPGVDLRGWVLLLGPAEGALVPLAALRAHWTGTRLADASFAATVPPVEFDPLPQPHHLVEFVPGDPPADVVPVFAGLGLRTFQQPRSFWANPVVLRVLLGLLVGCFALGLFFVFRLLMRESADMRARADFLTSVTHELKTPLSSIRLLSEMLDEGRVRTEAKKSEYDKLLAGESSRLTVLIENVLDLGRMERGERAHDPHPHVPDEVVEEAVAVFAPVASREHMAIDVDLAADDRLAAIDRGALVQALLNVLENARKYAGTGRVELSSHSHDGRYRLTIRDHGKGIPDAEREAIFERFQRGAGQKDGSVPGVGLGLYLARTILRAHGGDLSCTTPDGPGAEFVFEIPYSAGPMRNGATDQ